MNPNGDVSRINLPDLCSNDGEIQRASIYYYVDEEKFGKDKNDQMKQARGSYQFSVRHYDGNMQDLELIEPDGTVWKATYGYCYGAGHMD